MTNLILWSGVALFLGGALWAITSIVHPNNYDPNATRSRFWKPALGGQALSYSVDHEWSLRGAHFAQKQSPARLRLLHFVRNDRDFVIY